MEGLRVNLIFLFSLFTISIISAQPAITSFTPTNGPVGTSVTISGTDFNPVAENNLVYFGSTQATVKFASSTELIAEVPIGASYQPISVIANGLIAYSDSPFIVTFINDGLIVDEKHDFPTGASPSSIVSGDIDGDGLPEVIVTNEGDHTVSIFRNTSPVEGVISFASRINIETGQNPNSAKIGDLDNDGRLDLILVNLNSNTVSVLRNTSTAGSISFANKIDFSTGDKPNSVALGDLDGDGKVDIAVGNIDSHTISVFRNTSTGSGSIDFANKLDFTTSGKHWSIDIGDIDGDGKADLVALVRDIFTLSVFRNISTPGQISFETRVNFTAISNSRHFVMGDLDLDGKLDVAITNDTSPGRTSILRNTSTPGNISFATGQTLYIHGLESLKLGDLDGDGQVELVEVSRNGELSIFMNTSSPGSITFDRNIDLTTGVFPVFASIADLDGDGKPDLAAINLNDHNISVFRNLASFKDEVAFYPFYENVNDVSPNGFDGILDGPVLTANRFGDANYAYHFDGLDDHIDLGHTGRFSIHNIISITAWVNCAPGGNGTIVSRGEGFRLEVGQDGLVNFGTLGLTNDIMESITSVNDNQWHFLVATYDGYAKRLYVDGKLEAQFQNVSGKSNRSFNTFRIGGSAAITNFFAGDIDDVRLFSRAISEGEISNFYVEGKNPGIISFFPTSGPVGTAVTITGKNFDLSPSNNIVYFGATQAVVSSTTETTLDVTAPLGATYEPITVLTRGFMTKSRFPFIVTFANDGSGIDQETFEVDNAIHIPTSSNPRNVAIRDMNNDGRPDMLTSDQDGTKLYINKSRQADTVMLVKKNEFDFSLGDLEDLDGDGHPDIISWSPYGSKVHKNISPDTSTINFEYNQDIDLTWGQILDMDGDGQPDIIDVGDGHISILRNTSNVGTISFAARVDIPIDFDVYNYSIADLDGDNKPDLILAIDNNPQVKVLMNNSLPSSFKFQTAIELLIASHPTRVFAADIDRNDKLDLIVDVNNYLSIFRNTSTEIGTFSFDDKVDIWTDIFSLRSIGDLNGDGKADLALSDFNNRRFSFLENISTGPGSIAFDDMVDYWSPAAFPAIMAQGDLNGDSKPELTIVGSRVFIHKNNTASAHTATQVLSFGVAAQTRPTIINATNQSINIEVAYGSNIGALTPAFTLSDGATAQVDGITQSSGVTTNDFTSPVVYTIVAQDGMTTENWTVTVTEIPVNSRADILSYGIPDQIGETKINTDLQYIDLTVPSGSNLSMLVSTFELSAGATAEVEMTPQLSGTTANDFTNPVIYTVLAEDGNNAQDWTVNVTFPQPEINEFLPKSGTIETQVSISGSNFEISPADNVVHFGGTRATVTEAASSLLTVIVPNGATHKPITVLTNGLLAYSSIPFLVTFESENGTIDHKSLQAKVDFQTGSNPVSASVGDFNGDGLLDIATCNFDDNTLSILQNATSENLINFETHISLRTGSGPKFMTVQDLDNDGKLDIVLTNESDNTISIFRNTSSTSHISFESKTDITTGTRPFDILTGDLDGDGRSDLVISHPTDETISVLRNLGTNPIQYAPKVNLTTGAGPKAIDIGDIDGDGLMDLVVVNSDEASLSIFRNIGIEKGVINFADKIDFPTTGTASESLDIGDIDGDGKLDLAVANSGRNTVSVFRNISNIGSINLAANVDFETNLLPGDVEINDINGDGQLDLITSNTNDISLFQNTSSSAGSLSFADQVNYSVTGSSLTIGDIDEDGKSDLIVTVADNNVVSVFKNIIGSTVLDVRKNKDQIFVYPSPASSHIYVSGINRQQELAIIDMSGKIVKTIKTDGSSGQRINISALHSGTYLIRAGKYKSSLFQVIKN